MTTTFAATVSPPWISSATPRRHQAVTSNFVGSYRGHGQRLYPHPEIAFVTLGEKITLRDAISLQHVLQAVHLQVDRLGFHVGVGVGENLPPAEKQ
jgi:hypothetical protein